MAYSFSKHAEGKRPVWLCAILKFANNFQVFDRSTQQGFPHITDFSVKLAKACEK